MGILETKVVAITGAGAGIGRAVARLFAREGARVVLSDLGTDIDGKGRQPAVIEGLCEELRQAGHDVRSHAEDISTQAGAEGLIRTAIEQFSRIDVLVNCAGILREHAVLNLRDKDLVSVLDVQVIGTFRCLQSAAIAMRAQGGGRIINTTSPSALSGNYGQCANSAAAAAVIGLTRSAAAELVRHRIFVNAIAPLAKTRQTEHLPLFQKATTLSPEHVAQAYAYLASDKSGEKSGEIIQVAGDRASVLRTHESDPVHAENSSGMLQLDDFSKLK